MRTTGSALNTGDELVAIYLDEVYLARGVTIGAQDLLDVAGVEIVRGPQGTLQGRNATAGAILIRTADPTRRPKATSRRPPPPIRNSGARARSRARWATASRAGLSASAVDARGWGKNTYDGSRVAGDKSGQIRGVVTYSGDSPLTARISADYSVVTNIAALFRNAHTNFSTLPTGALVTAPTPTVPLTPAEHDLIYKDNKFASNPNTRTMGGYGAGRRRSSPTTSDPWTWSRCPATARRTSSDRTTRAA